jgi:hypothetical protein
MAAKKRAAELRVPLETLIEEGLRAQLGGEPTDNAPKKHKIHWITVGGEMPKDLVLFDREQMMDWIGKQET